MSRAKRSTSLRELWRPGMCATRLYGWWRAARSVALPFAVDRAEGDSTQIGKSPTRVIRSAVAAAALQPERHEHVPFDRLRITGAHHPDRADRQGRSRPVRRHVSPARRWLGDCLAAAGGGASATTAAG